MPTKRRKSTRNLAARVTSEAVEAWLDEDWSRLHSALRLKPWEVSPMHAHGDCPWPKDSAGAMSWPDMVVLRQELIAATGVERFFAPRKTIDLKQQEQSK